MARGKNKMKVIRQDNIDIDQDELLNMFQQLTGDPSKLDPEIIRDKYERLKNSIQRCNKLLYKFKDVILNRLITKINNNSFFDFEIKRLLDFLERSNNYIDEEVNEENLVHIYKALKESFIIEEYLKVCKVLKQGEDCIKDRVNLSDIFIKRAVGDEFIIFDFCKINFKHLFNHILSENISDKKELEDAKTYILLTLNMLYITTQDIYNIISSPDIDIDKFSEIIIQAIGAAKKQISRCDKAFRLIENSIDLLKNSMNSYYKDFVATSNPMIIFENFIGDVSNDLHIDTQTMAQFKRIIFHFRKKADNMQIKNNKLDGVFSTLNKIISSMEDKTSTEDTSISDTEDNET